MQWEVMKNCFLILKELLILHTHLALDCTRISPGHLNPKYLEYLLWRQDVKTMKVSRDVRFEYMYTPAWAYTSSAQKVKQHVYFLGPVLLDTNNILRAAAFKCPAFMHVVARFPAR
jgi:hypothetical protein